MQSALHITTRVMSGNKVEIQLPPGSEGQEVNVFVVLTEKVETNPRLLDVAEMSADPDIKREISAINSEFAISEMDGL